MSRFACRCGFEIRDISCPSTHEAYLVTDLELDDVGPDGRAPRLDVLESREVIECPQCWRLWVQIAPRGRYLPFVAEAEPLQLSKQQGGYRG
jgi:hypothetical protein